MPTQSSLAKARQLWPIKTPPLVNEQREGAIEKLAEMFDEICADPVFVLSVIREQQASNTIHISRSACPTCSVPPKPNPDMDEFGRLPLK